MLKRTEGNSGKKKTACMRLARYVPRSCTASACTTLRINARTLMCCPFFGWLAVVYMKIMSKLKLILEAEVEMRDQNYEGNE
jgi:hypothetical protein